MQEQIGKVTIQYREEEILLQTEALEDARIRELLAEGYDCRQQQSPDWPVLYHLSHLRANLTQWLPVKKTDRVLEFGADSGELTGGFAGKAAEVICLEENFSRCKLLATRHQDVDNLVVYAGDLWKNLEQIEGNFDWIIAPGILSEAQRYFAGEDPQVQALRILKKRLHPKGHLVLAVDNRFGMKYWAGAMEPHTGRYFDSLEGNGSTCSRKELEVLLEKSGLGEYRMYYPYPERWFPMSMYSDHWLPGAGELNQNLRNFEGERLVLFDEEKVYEEIKESLGVDVVRLEGKPDNMSLVHSDIDTKLNRVCLIFANENTTLEYQIVVNYQEKSHGYDIEDEKIKEELIKEGGNEIRFTQYKLPDESKENTAEFVYQDVFYTLNAVMDEEDFKKILKNLYFF